jgi:hypothetical protein
MNALKLLILGLLFACMVESAYTQNSASVSFSAAAQDSKAFANPATPAAAQAAAPTPEVAPQGATPVGRVVWVRGGSFKATFGNKERTLSKTSVIYLHDRLVTDDKTMAEIVFTDNTLITFNPSTNFSVDDYSYAPKPKGSVGHSVMRLIEGGFRTITGLIAKHNPPDYSMNTPVATIGVRGTDYRVQMQNGQLFIGFNTGKPCVKSKNKGKELCLDNATPYAEVASADSEPQGLTQRPAALSEQQEEITPAKIAGFGSMGGPNGGSTQSFCIGQ